MTSDTLTSLTPRRVSGRVGAVEEYSAVHRAALDGLVRHGLEAAAATVRLRAEARRLAAVHDDGGSHGPGTHGGVSQGQGHGDGGGDRGAGVLPSAGAGNGGGGGPGTAVVPFVAETEAAIAEVHDEYRQLTVHVLRMARYRLGLC